jgi:hypothetical protein
MPITFGTWGTRFSKLQIVAYQFDQFFVGVEPREMLHEIAGKNSHVRTIKV